MQRSTVIRAMRMRKPPVVGPEAARIDSFVARAPACDPAPCSPAQTSDPGSDPVDPGDASLATVSPTQPRSTVGNEAPDSQSAASVVEAAPAPVVETAAASVVGTAAASVVETAAASVVETAAAPVVETAAAPVAEAPAASDAVQVEDLTDRLPPPVGSATGPTRSQRYHRLAALRCLRAGDERFADGLLRAALSHYDEAVRIDPQLAPALDHRGVVRELLGDLVCAEEDYTESIRLDPLDPDAYAHRGNVRLALGKLDGCLGDYDCAIALRPTDETLYNSRGNARLEGLDLDGALQDYERAIELDPGYAHAFCNRANVHNERGALARAIEDYQRYLDLGGGQVDGDEQEVALLIAELKGALA